MPDTLGRYATYARAITRAADEHRAAGEGADWAFHVRFRPDTDAEYPWAVIAVNLTTEREENRSDERIEWA